MTAIAIHKHGYDTSAWQSDSTGHWHICKCGDRQDIAAHKENQGTITTEPAATTDGVKTYQCGISGCTTRTEVIEKTGDFAPTEIYAMLAMIA